MSSHDVIEYPVSTAQSLPDRPNGYALEQLVARCRSIYDNRECIISTFSVEDAYDAMNKAASIEKYVKDKEHRAEVTRATRILETAVGEALGEAEPGKRTDLQPLAHERQVKISKDDAHRFRLMAAHRDLWWPRLAVEPLSRRQVLRIIADANRPRYEGPGEAHIWEMPAAQWLAQIENADLLLTDPPYSTDVADIDGFVSSWFPAALKSLAPHGRAFVFIGAYAEELGAYFSHTLPDGWKWGVPHAWCYRNAIGPTPEYDFIRNWQCMLTVRGPDAPPLRSDRINDLLAGYIENAPDGRHETKLHRWQKPLTVMDRLIRLATDPGDMVIDPFAGSGTTLIAAKEAGRNGSGCDIDPDAIHTCKERGCHAG